MERGTLRQSALLDLERYEGNREQQALKEVATRFLELTPGAFERKNPSGRIVASAVVIDPEAGKVLLHHSRKLGRWVQLGGHCEEGDETLLGAALREAQEESGLRDLQGRPGILDLDLFTFRRAGGEEGVILDVRYLLTGDSRLPLTLSPEALELCWWPLTGLSVEPGVQRAVQAAAERLSLPWERHPERPGQPRRTGGLQH